MIALAALPWARIAIYAAVFGAGFASAGWIGNARIARLEARHANEISERDRKSAIALGQALKRAQDNSDRASKAQETLSAEMDRLAKAKRDLDGMHSAYVSVRDQLSTYARGRDSDPSSAHQARSETLATAVAEGADLLNESRGLLTETAGIADERAQELIACINAWPR